MEKQTLKHEVYNYWNKASCGTDATQQQKFSWNYFQEIEAARYATESEIFSFAQFTRFHGKKMLEVGVGAGTDFLQWVRAGADCYGIDLTHEGVDNVKHRLDLYGLKAQDIQVADAERLPHINNYFDLVYSWGVIHHSPDTIKCLEEIIRVTKPGGIIKVMIYNRYSLFSFDRYLFYGLLKGKPFQTLSTVLFNHMESIGTKAYTINEVKKILKKYPVKITQLKASVTRHELSYYKAKPWRWLGYLCALMSPDRLGFFMTIELEKKDLNNDGESR